MKFSLQSNPRLWPLNAHAISKALRVLFFSTTNANTSSYSSSSSSAPTDTLSRRIWRAGNPHRSIIPVLEQWLEEGKRIKPSDLVIFIKQLRKYRRYRHALQISEWVNEHKERGFVRSPADLAVHLDLMSKVHGIEKSEMYFNNIPDHSRNFKVYGAMLNCYAHVKRLERAEAIMEEMRELGFMKNALPYNVMLSLYSQMGKHEKMEMLMKEMEANNIDCDVFTFNILLNAYAAISNVEKMEKLLMKMEVDPVITIDWHTYVIAANGYLNACLIDKAIKALKTSEYLIKANSRRAAYEILITSYAAVGDKDEVYRVWELYKNSGMFFNTGYLCIINSLIKLEDIDGAERVWEEWASGKILLDIRIPNVMISAYGKKGLWEKAESFVLELLESGMELEPSSLDRLATGYRNGGQMAKAVEAMEKAISKGKYGWNPSVYTFAACLEYLKSQGDVEAAEELVKKLRDYCSPFDNFWKRLKEATENASQSTIEVEGDEDFNGEVSQVSEDKDMGTWF